jgi:hypothetical protein
MLRVHHLVGSAALLAGLLCVDSNVEAAEERSYPGSICKGIPDADAQGFTAIPATYGGTIYNANSSFDMTVICPLQKKFTRLMSGSFIRVFNRHPMMNFNCTLFNEYISGSQVLSWSDSEHAPGSGSDVRDISFNLNSGNGDYYYAVCTIPRKAPGQWPSHLAEIHIYDWD